MQNLSPLSFFWNKTTALLHADLLGLITPTSSMWSRWSFTSSSRPERIFLSLSLKGFGSVTLILCSAASVHPISPSSSVKMSWYLANKLRALFLFSSVQDSRPKSSNFSNKIFLLSSTVSLAQPSLPIFEFKVLQLCHLPPPSQEPQWQPPLWQQQFLSL